MDAAKKRAVAQYVDYDTFKNMVLVAHLKPIGDKAEQSGMRLLTTQHLFRLPAPAWWPTVPSLSACSGSAPNTLVSELSFVPCTGYLLLCR